jgi:hypothetical protein
MCCGQLRALGSPMRPIKTVKSFGVPHEYRF